MPDVAADSAPFASRAVTLGITVVVCALIGATLALWAHYGTAVFFEIVAAGIAACF